MGDSTPRSAAAAQLDEGAPAAAAPSGAASGSGAAADGAGDGAALEAWQRQYPMPTEQKGDPTAQFKALYTPPRNDAAGLAAAAAVIGGWALLFSHAMWGVVLAGPGRSPWWDVVGTFFALEFASAGLFITTHDAMHGTVCYRSRRLNDAVGWLAISLYAWFDYGMLHRKHWEHHGATGRPHSDPDFHRGNAALLPWFARFMWEYSTLLQFAKIFAWTMLLQSLGVQYANLVVYLAAAPILAAFRLFYFGTYLPHLPRDGQEEMGWQKSHSYDGGALAAFLQCYCFGYHLEHHRWPYAPWWDLPRCKAITRRLQAEGKMGRQPPGVQRLLWL
ncbi:beta-carotene ketolase [Raphidocelis subcapitata]|uniref:Beta-carotene ketolase n=1 Tax=Raphidocelis subcapitata TaxID=307507 RepID=A0A2V0NJD9_9CHLO|nr:beta-carotene ketolase [Raphidocelis subcapitata]|eukprot:GBF87321.1 beta-carotene ketolase [Raphidocelis subcapitata]